MYYKSDRQQIIAFANECLDQQGKGFYFVDVLRVYRAWCVREKQDRAIGRQQLSAYLETFGFERGERKDIVRFVSGQLKSGIVVPAAETLEQRSVRKKLAREARAQRRAERKRDRYLKHFETVVADKLPKRSLYLQRLLGRKMPRETR